MRNIKMSQLESLVVEDGIDAVEGIEAEVAMAVSMLRKKMEENCTTAGRRVPAEAGTEGPSCHLEMFLQGTMQDSILKIGHIEKSGLMNVIGAPQGKTSINLRVPRWVKPCMVARWTAVSVALR